LPINQHANLRITESLVLEAITDNASLQLAWWTPTHHASGQSHGFNARRCLVHDSCSASSGMWRKQGVSMAARCKICVASMCVACVQHRRLRVVALLSKGG